MLVHTAKAGENVQSIAYQYGFHWRTVWEHQDNDELRRTRKDHDTLAPGDRVSIPEKRPKAVSAPTGRLSKYKLRGIPPRLVIRLLDDDVPRAGVPYRIEPDSYGEPIDGVTDSDGLIEAAVSIEEDTVTLYVGQDRLEVYRLKLRCLPPIDSLAGAKARLRNIDLFDGEIDAAETPETTAAIKAFQAGRNLEQTGQYDEPTQSALLAAHGV